MTLCYLAHTLINVGNFFPCNTLIEIFGVALGARVRRGIVGWTRWNWAHIDNLWIDEKYRNQGYGLSLLSLAEKIATERKCNIIDLDTFDFQAPEFYLKNGYEKLFTLDGFGNNNSKIFLKKKLK